MNYKFLIFFLSDQNLFQQVLKNWAGKKGDCQELRIKVSIINKLITAIKCIIIGAICHQQQ